MATVSALSVNSSTMIGWKICWHSLRTQAVKERTGDFWLQCHVRATLLETNFWRQKPADRTSLISYLVKCAVSTAASNKKSTHYSKFESAFKCDFNTILIAAPLCPQVIGLYTEYTREIRSEKCAASRKLGRNHEKLYKHKRCSNIVPKLCCLRIWSTQSASSKAALYTKFKSVGFLNRNYNTYSTMTQ